MSTQKDRPGLALELPYDFDSHDSSPWILANTP